MSEQTNYAPGTDVFEVLGSVDLSTIDTSMPVLAPGQYEFEIAEMERAQSKTKEGTYLKIKLKLVTENVQTITDEHVNPGFPLLHMISLVRTDNYDPLKSIAVFLDALGLRDQPFDQTFESYVGRTLVAKTKVDQEREDPNTGQVYPKATRVAAFVKAA